MLHIAIPVFYGKSYGYRQPLLYSNLEFLSSVNCPIFVLAQEWEPQWVVDFKQKFPHITLYEYEKRLGMSGSRNETIKRCLYDTDADFMYTFDADQVILNIYNILDLFKIVHNSPHKIPVDMIKSGFVEIQGFKKFNIDNKDIVENNFTLYENGSLGGANYFVRNLKKYFNKEIYYKEYVNNEYVFEDIYFSLSLIQEGLKIKKCEQLWCKTPKGFNDTTLDNKPKEPNIVGNKRTKRVWLETLGYELKDYVKVRRKLSPTNLKYEISRNTPHKLTEYELKFKPKSKKLSE